MLKISRQKLLPACVRYSLTLSRAVNEAEQAGADPSAMRSMLLRFTDTMNGFASSADDLSRALEEAGGQDSAAYARELEERVMPAMEKVRVSADALELITDKEEWPLPSYGEMLFHIV
jgi:glutamine synthetase